MHSLRYSHDLVFHFDSGLEGDLPICSTNQSEIRIPAEAIVYLVAKEYILPKKIEKLESMSSRELLLGND